MDDYELDRIASDNPALTAPAAQRAPISRQKSRNRQDASTTQSGSSQNTATPDELSKYDVGRRVSDIFTKTLIWFRLGGVGSCEISRHHGSV